MPMYQLNQQTISVYNGTETVVKLYHQALAECRLITSEAVPEGREYKVVEGTHFDSRLIIDPPVNRSGLGNRISRQVERVIDGHFGGRARNLNSLELDIGSPDLFEVYLTYIDEWSSILSNLDMGNLFTPDGLSDEEIARVKVNNNRILVMHLIARLVLFVICQDNILKIDHENVFKAIDIFIDKLISHQTLFRTSGSMDSLAQHLAGKHANFIGCFVDIVNSLRQFETHTKAMFDMDELMYNLTGVAQRQMIAYWEPATPTASFANSNYRRVLREIEEKIVAINSSSTDSSIQTFPQTFENIHTLILASAKLAASPYKSNLTALYTLLREINDFRLLIQNVRGLISTTGWMCLLGDFLKLNVLGEHLKNFFNDRAKTVLDIASQEPRLPGNSKAFAGLGTVSALNVRHAGAIVSKITQATRAIDNEELRAMVWKKIYQSVGTILNIQDKLGIEIVDKKKCFAQALTAPFAAINPATATATPTALVSKRPHRPAPPPPTPKELPIAALMQFFEESESYLMTKNYDQLVQSVARVLQHKETPVACGLYEIKDDEGNTLLHSMIRKRQIDAANWLIDNYNFDVLAFNKNRITPLKLAAELILQGDTYKVFYFKLCEIAQRETEPSSTLLEPYKTLLALNQHVATVLHKDLNDYKQIQQDRLKSGLWSIMNGFFRIFGVDYMVAGAVGVAMTYGYLSDLKKEQSYSALLNNLRETFIHSKETNSKVLCEMIQKTLVSIDAALVEQKTGLRNEYPLFTATTRKTTAEYDVLTRIERAVGVERKVAQEAQERSARLEQKDQEREQKFQKMAMELENKDQERERKAQNRLSELEQKAQERQSELEQKAQERQSELEQKAQERQSELEQKAQERQSELDRKIQFLERQIQVLINSRGNNPHSFFSDSQASEMGMSNMGATPDGLPRQRESSI